DPDDQWLTRPVPAAYGARAGELCAGADRVTDMVTFERHDIIRDPVDRQYELVLCRNLFIYIDAEYKQPVIDSVRETLVDGGYLVIGKAETIPREVSDAFEVVDSKKRIYRRA
ncbi:MAG: CheR family methyltransferase, partial [Halobacteriales archaeon]